ncbi:MAG: hypothetical protein ABI305_02280 [Tepidiformaceae bacterium]
MAELTVGRIEPSRIATDATSLGQQGRQNRERQPRGRASRIPAVLMAALPGTDPEDCEMLYEYEDTGEIRSVLVRHSLTHATVARFDLDELTRLVAKSGQSGVLIERRG